MTPEQIQKLKDNWSQDPCWDIEDTEGFEAHKNFSPFAARRKPNGKSGESLASKAKLRNSAST